jgi:hypothetical protein
MLPGGIIYPLRKRLESGIYSEDYCYRKSEEDECLFREALSFWDNMASVMGDGVMSMEEWYLHSDRRTPKAEVLT